MNDRPTPETDAELHGINAVCKEERKLDAMTAHARKLERERDEAREALRTLAEHGENEIQKLIKERDEAREALMKIEDRCVDCQDACDDLQKIRDIAVKALEGEK